MEPKIGEYWYTMLVDSRYEISKIVKIDKGKVFIQRWDYSGYKLPQLEGIDYNWFLNVAIKWEPNWFWKMLGYK